MKKKTEWIAALKHEYPADGIFVYDIDELQELIMAKENMVFYIPLHTLEFLDKKKLYNLMKIARKRDNKIHPMLRGIDYPSISEYVEIVNRLSIVDWVKRKLRSVRYSF
jgi:hypothetical protein